MSFGLYSAARFGSAPFALSVHTGGGPGVGQTAQEGLEDVIETAKVAEQLGYHRFWMSEHHAMPALSIASPPLMMARLTADTRRFRLGAGGIMLPNHSPLIVAEQFGMLEALAPGRIDLGVGRAPGTDGNTAAALRRDASGGESLDEQVAELLGFLADEFPDHHPYSRVHAVPGPWQNKENRVPAQEHQTPVWILGSSPYSAQFAARLGRPYAFALQFGDADIETALRIYRENFVPSKNLDAPYVMVSTSAIANEDPRFAGAEASSSAMAMLRMFKRECFKLLNPQEVAEYSATLQEQAIIQRYVQRTLAGTAGQVARRLEELYERTHADELMLVTGSYSLGTAKRTLQLLAKHYQS